MIDSLRRGVPAALPGLVTLVRTLSRRAADVLAYFDGPGGSNGLTEAINGRLEHLRGTALGFRSLTNYITRALLDCGGFRTALHRLVWSRYPLGMVDRALRRLRAATVRASGASRAQTAFLGALALVTTLNLLKF